MCVVVWFVGYWVVCVDSGWNVWMCWCVMLFLLMRGFDVMYWKKWIMCYWCRRFGIVGFLWCGLGGVFGNMVELFYCWYGVFDCVISRWNCDCVLVCWVSLCSRYRVWLVGWLVVVCWVGNSRMVRIVVSCDGWLLCVVVLWMVVWIWSSWVLVVMWWFFVVVRNWVGSIVWLLLVGLVWLLCCVVWICCVDVVVVYMGMCWVWVRSMCKLVVGWSLWYVIDM